MSLPIVNMITGAMNSGPGNTMTQVVVHFTVSPSYKGIARRLVSSVNNGTAGGSTQYYVDAGEIVQAVREENIAWATGSVLGHNNNTINVELCGNTDSAWLDPSTDAGQTFILASKLVADICARRNIPVRLLSIEETKNVRNRGITTHYNISIADGPGGSDHVDGASPFPINEFIKLVANQGEEDMALSKDDIDRIAERVWSATFGSKDDIAGNRLARILNASEKTAAEVVALRAALVSVTAGQGGDPVAMQRIVEEAVEKALSEMKVSFSPGE